MNLPGAMTEVATLKKVLSGRRQSGQGAHRAGEARSPSGRGAARARGSFQKLESLELDSKTRESKLAQALESAWSAKAEAHKALQGIDAVKKIAAGKAFIMQSKHMKETSIFLTRVRSSPGVFSDLPRSALDAAEFYRAEEGSSTEKLFWSQYTGTEHPVPLSEQLKQLVELHKAAE